VEEVLRRPGVSAEDVEAVLRVHADRVHDAVRRFGVDEDTAVEVVEQSALALVDAVAQRPEQVTDAVGWWYACARRLSRGAAPDVPDLPLGGGVLSSDEDQLVLAEAVEELPEEERLALLLRDAYRLPLSSLAAALGTDEGSAMSLVARARLHAVPLLDDEPGPVVPAHAGSLSALARLGEHERVAPSDATVRRHVQACAACRAVRDAQERVHLLLSGLAVVALPPAVREGLLRRTEQHARAVLPPASALVLTEEEWDEWEDERRVLPPLFAVLGVLLALVLGAGIGVLASRGAGAVLPASSGVLPAVTLPPVEAPPPIRLPDDLPPPKPVPTPRTTVFFLPPRTTAPAVPSPTATSTSPAPTGPALDVDPSSGPTGATLVVRGAGWTPGSTIVVDYLDPAGSETGSRATATVDDEGRFRVELVADDPSGLPGPHEVRASDGRRERTATYQVIA
jgi:DNA-directed RNA polymerase specialized sigma24 family protein